MDTTEEAKQHVLESAKKQDIKFIRLWFTDILGFLKSFSITVIHSTWDRSWNTSISEIPKTQNSWIKVVTST